MRSDAELRRLLQQGMSDGDYSTPSSPEPKQPVRGEPLGAHKRKAGYSGRVSVGIKSFRLHLLDEDNLCIKYFVDGLRYAGIIRGDEPDKVTSKATQERVYTEEEERTEITITPL